ncbi:MAG: Holliday junction resolvase RuvX [Chloroflexota bacterium]|nr:Holliday junction resolvase RuvX [Chloroflexota bacterium]
MKTLAVDPGDKRIGLAISDPTGTLARPLKVLQHEAREKDAQRIIDIAVEEGVGLILVGWALDTEGEISFQARKSRRLADAIQEKTTLPVRMWDESGTTQEAIKTRIAMGVKRNKRRGHLDDLAASLLLQDFLNCTQKISKIKENTSAKEE